MRRPARAGAGEDPESLRNRIEADIVPSFGSGPPELARAVRYWKNALQALSSSSAARVQRVLLLARAKFRLPGHLAQPNRGHPGQLPGGRREPEASLVRPNADGLLLAPLAVIVGQSARSRERVTGIPIGHPRTSALRAMTASSASSAKSAMPSLASCVSEPDDLTQRCGLASGSELTFRPYGASW